MANYVEVARTNYFRVKDEEAFLRFVPTINGHAVQGTDTWAILFDEGVPLYPYDEETDTEGEMESLFCLAQHLADGAVAIVTAAAYEALRYCGGWANAINSAGDMVSINTQDIYTLAESLTSTPEAITKAEY